jgi:hypothetical protein
MDEKPRQDEVDCTGLGEPGTDPGLSFRRDDRRVLAYYYDMRQIREAVDRIGERIRTGYHPEMVELEILAVIRAACDLKALTRMDKADREKGKGQA